MSVINLDLFVPIFLINLAIFLLFLLFILFRVRLRPEAFRPNVLLMDSKLRTETRTLGTIVVGMTLVAALVGACSTGPTTAAPTTAAPTTAAPTTVNTADCRSFGGETVEAVAWSSGGNFLAVSTSSDADGQGRIRVFGWPEMNLVSQSIDDPCLAGLGGVPEHLILGSPG